jgi:hypothetical protein
MVRLAGFEPATFGSGDRRSSPAELQAHIASLVIDATKFGGVCQPHNRFRGQTEVRVRPQTLNTSQIIWLAGFKKRAKDVVER